MVTIDSNCHICMNRGDTLSFPIFINATGSKMQLVRYRLKPMDTLYVCVAEPLQKWEDALIKKAYTALDVNDRGDVVFKLNTLDTEYLAPGTYHYEIKLVTRNAKGELVKVTTILPKKKFIIME